MGAETGCGSLPAMLKAGTKQSNNFTGQEFWENHNPKSDRSSC